MKISIIVPVYRVEKYIERCIQSLLEQTYVDFEAIIVDDGSPDNSIQLAKNIIGDDSRFIFLEQQNGGLSSARNYGLDYASGDYIGFLDSDDYLSCEAFSKCIAQLNSIVDIDILIFGFQEVDESYQLGKKYLSNLSLHIQRHDNLLLTGALSINVWCRLYKKEIFEDIRFVTGLIYEDKEISYKLLYGRKLHVLPEYLYFYTQRTGSIMHSYNAKSIDSYFYIYNEFQCFIDKYPIDKSYKKLYQKSYIKYCFYKSILTSMKYSPNYLEDCQKVIKMIDPQVFSLKNLIRIYSPFSSKVVLAILFKLSPSWTKKLYKFFNI